MHQLRRTKDANAEQTSNNDGATEQAESDDSTSEEKA